LNKFKLIYVFRSSVILIVYLAQSSSTPTNIEQSRIHPVEFYKVNVDHCDLKDSELTYPTFSSLKDISDIRFDLE